MLNDFRLFKSNFPQSLQIFFRFSIWFSSILCTHNSFNKMVGAHRRNKFICWLLIINEKQQWWQSFIFLLACLRYILSRNSCISTSLELEQLYMNHVWGITHFMSNLCCFIESWRTGMILRLRRLCLKGWNILRNISWKCSRWLVEKKPVKTPETLGDGLGRVETSQECLLQVWRCKLIKSLSRVLLSSKSPPGVLEDKDIPETLGDRTIRVETSQGMFAASLKMIGWQKACQDSFCPPSFFLESWRTRMFLRHFEMVLEGLIHT